jgi:hypothetical protein
VDMFGCRLKLQFHGERGCVPQSDEFFEIRLRSMCFGCWANFYCNYRNHEVPTSRILIQTMLEALEGSGKA